MEDLNRQPSVYTSDNVEELFKLGYVYNKSTGIYEKKIFDKSTNKTIILKTIRLRDYSDDAFGDIHYACSPENNNEDMHIGFLTRSKY